jgi:hypothetical protein
MKKESEAYLWGLLGISGFALTLPATKVVLPKLVNCSSFSPSSLSLLLLFSSPKNFPSKCLSPWPSFRCRCILVGNRG